MSSCLLNSTCLLSLQNSDAKYVSNKMLWQFQNFSVCLTSTLAEKSAKDSAETFAYYVGNGFAKPWHFAKGSDLVFQQLRLFVLRKLYYLFIIFPLLIALLWFLHASDVNVSTPSLTFNLSFSFKIVKLKTLCMPVSACLLKLSQSIVFV